MATMTTFEERKLWKQTTVIVKVIQKPSNRFLAALGIWLVKRGLLISGVGEVIVKDCSGGDD